MNKEIFVFGSNLAGRHGKGAALYARKHYGAEYGIGIGPTGDSYAIPTKGYSLEVLSLDSIEFYVSDFILYAKVMARHHPDIVFLITPIGTGLAGYSKEEIRPMFNDMPSNCKFTDSWNE